ncbi:MAG: hypothetical protein H6Q17_933 [Bacteroidetes bacterium]|jgi:hypothetical protein|nr:hypothetical protein [Bacteroidota bacterium]
MFSIAKVGIYYKSTKKIDKYFSETLFLSKAAFLQAYFWLSCGMKNILNSAKRRMLSDKNLF